MSRFRIDHPTRPGLQRVLRGVTVALDDVRVEQGFVQQPDSGRLIEAHFVF